MTRSIMYWPSSGERGRWGVMISCILYIFGVCTIVLVELMVLI